MTHLVDDECPVFDIEDGVGASTAATHPGNEVEAFAFAPAGPDPAGGSVHGGVRSPISYRSTPLRSAGDRGQASSTRWRASSALTTGGSVDQGKLIHWSVRFHTWSHFTSEWDFS